MRIAKNAWRYGVRALAMVFTTGLFAGMPSVARADLINIQSYPPASTGDLGTFTGTIEYGFDVPLDSWTVLITLTNTSPAGNGGFITGFIFNIDSDDPNASATLHSGTHPFANAANQSGNPLGGTYDAGATLGGSFQGGGGNPNQGIGVGLTGSFLFLVNASDAAALTASDFINGPDTYNFLVRFRGFGNGGSDMVPAEEDPGPVVPGPTALMVLAVGMVFFRRRSQRA